MATSAPCRPPVRVQFVEHQEPQVAVNGVTDLAFLQPGQQEFEHHVVREEYLGRILLHLGARPAFFLPCILSDGYRKNLPCRVFVILFIDIEFVALGIDKSVHRVDDDRRNSVGWGFGQKPIENGANISQGFARAGAGSDDEVFARDAQPDGFQLMAVQRVALEDIGHRVVEQAALGKFFDAAGLFVGWIELEKWVGPKLTFRKRRMDLLADRGVGDVDKASDVTGVIRDDLFVGVEDVHFQVFGAAGNTGNCWN